MDAGDEDVFDDEDDTAGFNTINKIKTKLYNEGFSDGRLQGIKDLVHQRVKEGLKRGIEVGIISGTLYSECSMFFHRFNSTNKSKMDELLGNIRHILLAVLPHEVDTSKLLPELQLRLQELSIMVETEENQLLQKYNEFIDRLKLIEEKFGLVTHDAASNCCGGSGTCN